MDGLLSKPLQIARSDGASVSAAAKSNALDESCGPDLSFNVQDSLNHGAFVLGYRASDLGLHSFHPLPSELLFIWELYVENIDPVVKILHVPSTTLLIRKTAADMAAMSPEVEALMFSIYYAVITSLDEDEVSYRGLQWSPILNHFPGRSIFQYRKSTFDQAIPLWCRNVTRKSQLFGHRRFDCHSSFDHLHHHGPMV